MMAASDDASRPEPGTGSDARTDRSARKGAHAEQSKKIGKVERKTRQAERAARREQREAKRAEREAKRSVSPAPRRRGKKAAPAGEVFFEDQDLRISGLAGDSQNVIIVFTGLGLGIGPAKLEEFIGSARGDAGNTVIFVSDKTGMWYEKDGVAGSIRRELSRILADIGPQAITHIGNSMGAFGAVLFARDTGARHVLALGPQYSIKPGVVEGETRWARAAKRAGDVRVAGLDTAMVPDVTYILLHGLADQDRLHAALFPKTDNVHHYLFADVGHDTGRGLKKQKVLGKLVEMVHRGKLDEVDRIMTDVGAVRRADAPRRLLAAPRTGDGELQSVRAAPALVGLAGLLLALDGLAAEAWLRMLGGAALLPAAFFMNRRAR